jgi:hypothetical protein
MLQLEASFKVMNGWQIDQAVCPTVKYCHYILGVRWGARWLGNGAQSYVPSKNKVTPCVMLRDPQLKI